MKYRWVWGISLILGAGLLTWLMRPPVTQAQSTGTEFKVTIDPASGYFDHPVTVSIKTQGCTGKVAIHYTVTSYFVEDGSTGDTLVNDQEYKGPFTINDPVRITARADCENGAKAKSDPVELVVCSPNCYWIAVVGDRGQDVSALYQQVKTMVRTMEPWATLRQASHKIVVVKMDSKGSDLHCRELDLHDNGKTFPLCPDVSAARDATKNGPAANFSSAVQAIIIGTSVDCNCGTVENAFSPVMGLGASASVSLIAHEFGHLTGKMVDEYYYQYGYQGGPLGNNCFASQSACQVATRGVQGAQCSVGCRAVDTWRPSTELMHNEVNHPYGPLETCIMAKKIMDVIGFYQNNFGSCEAPDPSPLIVAPPVKQGNYYGGRRDTSTPLPDQPTTTSSPTKS